MKPNDAVAVATHPGNEVAVVVLSHVGFAVWIVALSTGPWTQTIHRAKAYRSGSNLPAGAIFGTIPAQATGGAPPPAKQGAPEGLEGTAWNAMELNGTAVQIDDAADNRPHLVFGAGGRLSGADGCNRLTGLYTLEADGITFGQLAGTRMACPKTDEIVKRFGAALKDTSRWSIVNERLEFYGATGKPLAVFERRPAAPARRDSLQGTTWQLVKFQGGDDRTLTPDDPAKYTVEFAAGGRIAARVDCNRGRGTWKVTAAGQLELGPLALTRAKCPDGSLHDQIAKQWTNVRSFVLKDGHLFLSLMADGGTYEFAPAAANKR